MNKSSILLSLTATLTIVAIVISIFQSHSNITKPSFDTIKDVPTLKQAFFSYLLPKIQQHNDQILHLRAQLTEHTMSATEISSLEQKYKTSKEHLLKHIDIIPPSLVLAQAAIESDWGRSRFSKYNNFFGIWCFAKGCGVVPKKRDKDARHEVAIFSSVDENIAYYMLILNSYKAYADFRNIRADIRNNNQTLLGIQLVKGLTKYSSTREKYITTVEKLINQNDLSKHDVK